jgi:hypothetical protein
VSLFKSSQLLNKSKVRFYNWSIFSFKLFRKELIFKKVTGVLSMLL